VYDQLMPLVVDVKDLGSGVIGGVECDHLAFRTKDVDWQIWIAQGARPYPCKYVITSKLVAEAPQYSVQIRDWKTGNEVASDDFSFNNSTNAKKIDLNGLDTDELPKIFAVGGSKRPCRSDLASWRLSIPGIYSFISTAQAVVGRPLTHVSVAGGGTAHVAALRCRSICLLAPPEK
jgi:hypothetical protein